MRNRRSTKQAALDAVRRMDGYLPATDSYPSGLLIVGSKAWHEWMERQEQTVADPS